MRSALENQIEQHRPARSFCCYTPPRLFAMPTIGKVRVGHRAPDFRCDAVEKGEMRSIYYQIFAKSTNDIYMRRSHAIQLYMRKQEALAHSPVHTCCV